MRGVVLILVAACFPLVCKGEEPERISIGISYIDRATVKEKAPELLKELKFPERQGVLVVVARPDSVFFAAGGQSGDFITAVDGVPIKSQEDFKTWADNAKVGAIYKITLTRLNPNGKWYGKTISIKGVAAIPEPPAKEKPTPAEKPAAKPFAVVGELELHLVKFGVGKVSLEHLGTKTQSGDELLWVKLRIDNKSATKKADYETWRGAIISTSRDFATAKDNFGNNLKRIDFGIGTDVIGGAESESIYPNKSVEDILVFEKPVDGTKTIKVSLPRQNVGDKGEPFEIELKIH